MVSKVGVAYDVYIAGAFECDDMIDPTFGTLFFCVDAT